MSDLIEKVEKHISEKLETYLAEGIEEDLFLKFCATNAVKTVLEEMLKGTDKTVPGWSAREYVGLFARDNNITIGGGK